MSDLDRIRYAKLIINYFDNELKTNKELPNILDAVDKAENEIKQLDKIANEARDKYYKERDFRQTLSEQHKQDINRFEQEVIHLKELVQEKNMVIDKLLAEKKLND